MHIRYLMVVTALMSVGFIGGIYAAKDSAQIQTMAQFKQYINEHKKVSVLFYNKKKLRSRPYQQLAKAYGTVAKDAQNKHVAFTMVDVSQKEGELIFDEYASVLDDGTLVRLPAVILFNNGIMVDNELGGNITSERIQSFIERTFKA